MLYQDDENREIQFLQAELERTRKTARKYRRMANEAVRALNESEESKEISFETIQSEVSAKVNEILGPKKEDGI